MTLDNIVDDRRRVIQATNSGHIKASELRRQVLERADIVAATLSGAGSQPILEVILRISGFKFDAVIIDEAAQAVEPSTLIPFKYNPGLIVMVGDPCQLPATVFSRVCKEHNYSQSLFLRLQRTGLPVAMLETQYRMHPLIAEFPSARYYNHSLLTDSSVATLMKNGKAFYNDSSCHFRPLVFFDLAYSSERNDNRSFSNPEEARFVVAHLQRLIQGYPGEGQNVGIIAPYRAQRKLIVQSLRQALGNELCAELDPEISTVDGFQGREKDIIIFSCVRASKGGDREGSGIGFLKEWQRLNVAVTRAKYALWIVGHQQTLQRDPEWRALLDFVRQRNVLFSLQKDQALPMRGDSSNSSAAPRDDSRARDDYHNRHRRRDDEQPRHHHHHHHGRSAKNNHHHHKHRNRGHHSQKPPSNDPK